MSKKYPHTQPRINTEMIISLVIIMITTLGSTIPLYVHTSSQIQEMSRQTQAQLTAIREEMKDFHGRLCAIEERNKK